MDEKQQKQIKEVLSLLASHFITDKTAYKRIVNIIAPKEKPKTWERKSKVSK